jgi:mannose-6-phosphate isomerase-like protein (cupin superfamily)
VVFEVRPWDRYVVLQSEATFQVKKLVVTPDRWTSLQSHKFLAEHWFIVSGQGIADIDGEEDEVGPGNSVDILIGSNHRVSCGMAKPLVFIEIQTGSPFAEDDIVPYEDDYRRFP